MPTRRNTEGCGGPRQLQQVLDANRTAFMNDLSCGRVRARIRLPIPDQYVDKLYQHAN
jgi:hypothetical protein